jgi:hypothetical protein
MRKNASPIHKLMLSGIIFASGMAGTVHADLLVSGAVFGGPTQKRVACQVANAGTTPITIVQTVIFSQFSTSVPLSFNNCNAPLGPNRICTFQAAAINQAYSCKVLIVGPKTNVRGTASALGASSNALSESDLR